MPPFNLQGFNLTCWNSTGFSNKALNLEALNYIKNQGSNLVTIDYAVNFKNNGSMVELGSKESLIPNSDDLIYVIKKAHELGLNVILKPHTTLEYSGINRNLYNTDSSKFLASNFFLDWGKYLSSLSKFAESNNIQGIVIGTELDIFDSSYRAEWSNLISSIRDSFSGQLTYDSLFSVWEDKIGSVSFWDLLDYISCSLYVPLSSNDLASESELMAAFLNNPYGKIGNVIQYLANISEQYNKPIMAIEGGYQSVVGALDLLNLNTLPHKDQVVNYSIQANGLNAYLKVLEAHGASWLKGVSLWQVTPANMSESMLKSIYHTNEFTTYQKPAAQIISDYYKGVLRYDPNSVVYASGENVYGGVLNNVFEISQGNTQSNTLSFNLTGSLVNKLSPTIDVIVNEKLVDSYQLNTQPSTYFDVHGVNWNVNQIYSSTYTGSINSVKLVFKGANSGTKDDKVEGAFIHSFLVNGNAQNLSKTIQNDGFSTNTTNSLWRNSSATLDLGNRDANLLNGTTIHGGPNLDTISFSEKKLDYHLKLDFKNLITISDSTGKLESPIHGKEIERLQFSDKNIALDLAPTQSAGQTALLIGAVLPGQLVYDVSKQALLGSVVGLFDQNFTLAQLSGAILRLPIWDVLTGKAAPTNADIASYLVNNVYGGTQSAAITNAAIAAMNAETPATQGNYLASLAVGDASQAHINLVGLQATGLVYLG